MSSNNVDASGQMRGWFKLIETIRKTDPPCSSSNELFKPTANSHTNGYPMPIESPQSTSPNFIPSPPPPLDSPPIDDTPSIDVEPEITPPAPKRRSLRHKKITIRKSTRSKEVNFTPDDDSISLDLHQRKRSSNDLSTTIPLATDLQTLPGLEHEESRNQRFAHYSDLNTLSTHLHACLCIDKKPFSATFFSKQHIFKTRHNILTKIFKLAYLKTHPKFSPDDLKKLFSKKSDASSSHPPSTSTTFKTDWSVNRRNSSSYRHDPKNVFHILQLNPKKRLFSSNDQPLSTDPSNENQHETDYEHMKDLLIRTYYPHYHATFQCGYYFGSKLKFPIQENDLFKSKDESKRYVPSIFQRQSKKRGRRSKHHRLREEPALIKPSERRVSEEIPPADIPIPTEISSPILINNTRKRRNSFNVQERKKKTIVSVPSPEISFEDGDPSVSDSEEDLLPDELPKQNFIKNGLRSNYYKSSANIDSKSTSQKTRSNLRRFQPTGSLPPFYTGLFQSIDENFAYMNYRLPYDIYWLSQKVANPPKKSPYRSKKKTSISHKNIPRNISISSSMKIPFTREMEDLTADEKQIVSQTSIFLQRNLRRIKDKRQRKTKQQHGQKQQIDEQPLSLFVAQNYYHPKTSQLSDSSNLTHKDLLNFFVNHIRRSQFGKLGRCSIESIDPSCSYAQLAQLTIILNEIFDFLLNYKCQNSDIYPSNALKKCPLKRLFPMYYELISKPIDLTTIRQKLDQGEYFSYSSFQDDLLLLFCNAITYCGEDSDVGRAVKELERYFLQQLKVQYQSTINFLPDFKEGDFKGKHLGVFKDFIARLHGKEVLNGQIREILAEMIFQIDSQQPSPFAPPPPRIIKSNWIVHCPCGSTFDETPLVQCYACQLWQHVSCVVIKDSFRPYYCFECHPLCEEDPSSCSKMNIQITQEDQTFYSTITRPDGLIIRINECYLVRKDGEKHTSMDYDIFSIERLWFDESHRPRASGFYYLRPMETFHEPNRKFYPNEVFRFPSTNDSISIESIIRPCYVLDPGTFCKGKPLAEYTSRISPRDVFICEYRLDKSARTFTRLPKSKHINLNTKSYCFDNYIEKLSIKRESQSDQNPRRRSITHWNKLTAKQLEEKSSHIDGLIEKIYCHFHHPNLIPLEAKFSPDQFIEQQPIVDQNNNRGRKRLRDKPVNTPNKLIKKRRTRSFSDNDPHVLSTLLYELIESIASHPV